MLECRSYIAAMSGDIIAYLRGGYSLTVPDRFFLRRRSEVDATLVLPEQNGAVCDEVETWLRRTLAAYEKGMPETVLLGERPYPLNQLLKQCELEAPEIGELKEWHDTPDVDMRFRVPLRERCLASR